MGEGVQMDGKKGLIGEMIWLVCKALLFGNVDLRLDR